ncbi:7206_t:CDS:2 [Diversispora eburnea]|uniref:Uricase n=1 Tax=Diversispora eburnea TaxID=1213867 RepID=A0A9N8V9G9_9GLOM|nr:7206_t:CDS:2 [Diversispora eburnea]
MSDVFISQQSYGKDNIRLIKVFRNKNWHEVVELTIDVLLDGDFTAAYTEADNSKIVATDSMKNTVYILAKQSSNVQNIELFATEIGRHFIFTYSHVSQANVSITKHKWTRMLVDGKFHDHSFYRDGEDTHNAKVIVTRINNNDDENSIKIESIESGLKNLLVLKTTGSKFSGFIRDKYTTLPETNDRILSTSIDATWTYNIISPNVTSSIENIIKFEFDNIFESIRSITLNTFATHDSESVQATLYLMANSVLKSHPQIESIRYELPNKHSFAYDLERFGLKNGESSEGNDADIFVPFDKPNGIITATISRKKELL